MTMGYVVLYSGNRDDSDYVYIDYMTAAKIFLDIDKAFEYCDKVNEEEREKIRNRGEYPDRYNYYMVYTLEILG